MKKNYLLIGVAALLLGSCCSTKNITTTQTTTQESALIANGKLFASLQRGTIAIGRSPC